jgi:hypothetical protein
MDARRLGPQHPCRDRRTLDCLFSGWPLPANGRTFRKDSTSPVRLAVPVQFHFRHWPWPGRRHFTAEHLPELREFVDGLAPSEAREAVVQAGIVGLHEARPPGRHGCIRSSPSAVPRKDRSGPAWFGASTSRVWSRAIPRAGVRKALQIVCGSPRLPVFIVRSFPFAQNGSRGRLHVRQGSY